MTEVTDEVLEKIKKENERIIMKTFGVEYEEYFPQEHQYAR